MTDNFFLPANLQVHKDFATYFGNPVLMPYLYLLSRKLSEGSVCVDLNDIDFKELKMAGYAKIAGEAEIREQDLVSEGALNQPFVLWHHKLYLQRYFKYEKVVFEKIKQMIEQEATVVEERKTALRKFQDALKNPNGSGLGIDWQLVGAIQASINNFTIITGGPGTGKTTSLAMVLSAFFQMNPELKVALTAPTGKAANRMMESLGQAKVQETVRSKFLALKAFTIDRLLGYQPNSIYFQHNQEHPLPYDWIIVDETSMLDMAKFAKLLDAVEVGKTRIVLLGDKDQLASVEAGSLFGDLCLVPKRLNQFTAHQMNFLREFLPAVEMVSGLTDDNRGLLTGHIIELQHSHRFQENAGIGKLSRAVIQNEVEKIEVFFKEQDRQVFLDTDYTEDTFHEFVKRYEQCFTRQKSSEMDQDDYALLILNEFKKQRILCAVRQGEQGIYQMNERVEQALEAKGILSTQKAFYEFRPVLITKNNYDLELFNGDIGIVLKNASNELKLCFEINDKDSDTGGKSQKVKWVHPSLIDDCETCFAMTIHKSQGSEFDHVFMVLPKQKDLPLLTRELVYTGLTRAKERIILQCSKEVLLAASEKSVVRGSGIKDRFEEK